MVRRKTIDQLDSNVPFSETPFGKLPILEIDGVTLGESKAICRYVAKKVGLAGKNDIEDAQIDAIVDVMADYAQGFQQKIASLIHLTRT